MDISSPHAHVSSWLAKFSDALEKADTHALKSLFAKDCYWRDLVAFTWNIKTMEGREVDTTMCSRIFLMIDGHSNGWVGYCNII